MATKKTSETFTPEEKAAMRQRAKELKANASKEAALKEVLAAFKKMSPADREIAEKLHALVKKTAPQLWAKTWYGMPAYAGEDGKAVLFYQDAGKFKTRYSTIGFNEQAKLDDGAMWATSFAVIKWNGAVEKQVAALIKKAVS
ncbi:MAG: hypothetical protein RIR24_403 [Actinomycetota bacterium]|jgi:uncharacterized protein YdhG (YjbR/CyaY superfamily)